MVAVTVHPVFRGVSRMLIRRPRAVLWNAVCGLLLAACGRVPAPQAAAPADIAALEAKRAQTPDDPALNLRLAQAYYGAARYGEARAALATVLAAQPTNAQARPLQAGFG